MDKQLNFEPIELTELEDVLGGGSSASFRGCVITNGQCDEGGCAICNGHCGKTTPTQEPTPNGTTVKSGDLKGSTSETEKPSKP